jgi:hypothetical protein
VLNNVSIKDDGDLNNPFLFFLCIVLLCRKTLGIITPIEGEHKDEAGLAKDQTEQSRQRLVKLEEDGLEFV